MATVIVQTDDGAEVWRLEQIEPWHVSSIIHGQFTNIVCRSLTSGLLRAIGDADLIQRGLNPERPSEKAIRLAEAARKREAERVADPDYVPTVGEALRNPAAFVEGMQEM